MLKTLGTMGVIASVTDNLQGIDFPRSKEDIVEYARDSNAPDEVIEILERIPMQTYSNMGDLVYRMRGF
jgi:hypothetical protein